MKHFFTILFCLVSLISLAQSKRYKVGMRSNVEAKTENSFLVDSALGLPRYSSKLDTATIKYLGREKDALLFADTLHGYLFWYNPHTGIVDTVNKGGAGEEGYLQGVINKNPKLDRSNIIDFRNYGLTLRGDTLIFSGTPSIGGSAQAGPNTLTTKFGVLNSNSSLSGQVATTTGLPVIRSFFRIGTNTYPFENIASAFTDKEVHVVVNLLSNDSTMAYPDSAAIDNYMVDLSGIIDQHFTPYTIFYVAAQNEPFNSSIYRLDASSARRYAYFLKRLSGLFKRKNRKYYISDGGVSGPAMDYFVLKYLDSTGQSAAYNAYKAARFTPAQQTTVDNWAASGTYVNDIARYKEYFSYLKDMDSVDAINLHYPLPINNDDDFDTSLLCSAVEAYSFLSGGKDIVFNEVDFRNQSTTIPPKVVAKFNNLGVKYVVFYNGTDNTYTGNNNAFTTSDGTSLLSNGSSLQTKFNALAGIIQNTNSNAMEVYKDGTVRFPGLANAASIRTDATGKLIPGAASAGGTGGGGTYISQNYTGDGNKTTIALYVGAAYTVTNVINTTENGGGITGSVQNGDSVYVFYSIAPYGAVTYKISVVATGGAYNATEGNTIPLAITITDRYIDEKNRQKA